MCQPQGPKEPFPAGDIDSQRRKSIHLPNQPSNPKMSYLDEGAASTITYIGDGYVRKTTKRSARRQATGRHDAAKQLAFHTRLYEHLTTPSAHPLFCTPKPRPSTEPHSYEMEHVETLGRLVTREYLLSDTHTATALQELETAIGFQLWDCEFYYTTDDKIVILDYDQVREIKGDGTRAYYVEAERRMRERDEAERRVTGGGSAAPFPTTE